MNLSTLVRCHKFIERKLFAQKSARFIFSVHAVQKVQVVPKIRVAVSFTGAIASRTLQSININSPANDNYRFPCFFFHVNVLHSHNTARKNDPCVFMNSKNFSNKEHMLRY